MQAFIASYPWKARLASPRLKNKNLLIQEEVCCFHSPLPPSQSWSYHFQYTKLLLQIQKKEKLHFILIWLILSHWNLLSKSPLRQEIFLKKMSSSPLFQNCFSNYIIGDIFFLLLSWALGHSTQECCFTRDFFFHMLIFISIKNTLHIFYKH